MADSSQGEQLSHMAAKRLQSEIGNYVVRNHDLITRVRWKTLLTSFVCEKPVPLMAATLACEVLELLRLGTGEDSSRK